MFFIVFAPYLNKIIKIIFKLNSKLIHKTINLNMTYNDFPILNNNEYKILNEQYEQWSKHSKSDRKSQILKICNELNNSISFCLQLKSKHNLKIRTSIEQTRQSLINLLDNICCCFNISLSHQNQLTNYNLFSFLKQQNHLLRLFNDWQNFEEKEYYKTIIQKSIIIILDCNSNLITSLEESNINFFKYM